MQDKVTYRWNTDVGLRAFVHSCYTSCNKNFCCYQAKMGSSQICVLG
jgi:hypothetical protein